MKQNLGKYRIVDISPDDAYWEDKELIGLECNVLELDNPNREYSGAEVKILIEERIKGRFIDIDPNETFTFAYVKLEKID